MAELSKVKLDYNDAMDIMKKYNNWIEETRTNFFGKMFMALDASEMSGDQAEATENLKAELKPLIDKLMEKSENISKNVIEILFASEALSQKDQGKFAQELASSAKSNIKEIKTVKRSL